MTNVKMLIAPLITEKGTQLAKNRIYGFIVDQGASKNQIKAAIEEIYAGVKVKSVRISRRKGKVRRLGKRRIATALPDRKIAYINLAAGDIDVFPKA